jgi:hypothetical protein
MPDIEDHVRRHLFSAALREEAVGVTECTVGVGGGGAQSGGCRLDLRLRQRRLCAACGMVSIDGHGQSPHGLTSFMHDAA